MTVRCEECYLEIPADKDYCRPCFLKRLIAETVSQDAPALRAAREASYQQVMDERTAVLAEREACARLCDLRAQRIIDEIEAAEAMGRVVLSQKPLAQALAGEARRCAEAIRAQS